MGYKETITRSQTREKFNYRTIVSIFLIVTTLSTFPAFAASQDVITEEPSVPAGISSELRADSETVTTSPDDRLSLNYAKGFLTDTGKILTSPLYWDKNDWLKTGLVVGVTGGLYFADESIRDFAQSHQNTTASKIATVGKTMGNTLYILPPVGAFYLYGYLADDKKARNTALLAVESLAISGLFSEAVKVTAQRSRPKSNASSNVWEGLGSGHTSSAFSIATVFAEEYKDSSYIPPVAYALATLTGLSSVYGNEHWASEVFFGAALGYFVGKAVVRFHKGDASKKISITPMVNSDYKGLTISFKF